MAEDYIRSIYSRFEALDSLDKLEIYLHYHRTQLCLKHNFDVEWKYDNGKQLNNHVILTWLWKDIHITTFEQFISPDNIHTTDLGENWQKHGYAQRYRTNITGIYDWSIRFKEDFAEVLND